MLGESAPLTEESDDADEYNEEKLEEMQKLIKERNKTIKKMSKYEKKLMKGLMRGFGNTMILWLISKQKLHGYEIMTKIHDSSPLNEKMPSASKIYPVLHDLEKNGLIKGTWGHQGKRKIKYYEITEEGKHTLSTFREIARFANKNKSSIWLTFIKDMLMDDEDEKELNL
ncbi:MAG: PadR family transcriptional regulator [Methanobacteriaceae archaeon]|nr:PadR family transcriptional regulator [Methanobacteriaceae archaeon]